MRVVIVFFAFLIATIGAKADVFSTKCSSSDTGVTIDFSLDADTTKKVGALIYRDPNHKALAGKSKSKLDILKVTKVTWYSPIVNIELYDPENRKSYRVDFVQWDHLNDPEAKKHMPGVDGKDMESVAISDSNGTTHESCGLK